MLKLKNRDSKRLIPREPFSFKPGRELPPGETIDYCELLKRPGYHDEDIFKEGLFDTLWGRTFFLENTNHLGVSLCYHVRSICPRFLMEAEYETGPIPLNLRRKIAKNRTFRKFTLHPVHVSLLEDDRELEFVEARRDYYWELRQETDNGIGGYVRSTADAVAYENCRPDRTVAYFYSQDGVELAQALSIYHEVVSLHVKIMNVSNSTRQLTARVSDRRGMGFEQMLGILPPSVRNDVSGQRLTSEYTDWPLAGLLSIVETNPPATWQTTEGNPEWTYVSLLPHSVGPGESAEMTVLCASGYGADELNRQMDSFRNRHDAVSVSARKEWNEYLGRVVPAFRCSDKSYEKLYYWSFYNQRFNLEDFYWDKDISPHVCPRRGTYPGAFWVDSTFNAVIDKWLDDPRIAMKNIEEVCPADESSVLGTPALAIWDYYCRDPRPEVLQECLRLLHVSEAFFVRNDREGNGIPSLDQRVWDYPYRWAEYYDGSKGSLTDYAQMVDVASMAAYHYDVVSKLCAIQGDAASARLYRQKYETARQAINQRMWNPETGFYHDVIGRDGRRLSCKAGAGFATMIAAIPDRAQALSLVRHLEDEKEFKTPLRIPTISRSSRGYNPKGYWYGCVWAPLNWMVIEGLAQYDRRLASQIIHEWVQAATAHGYPDDSECFSSLGEGQCLSLQSWSGLIADLMIRRIMGVTLRPDDLLEFYPFALNRKWEYASFENFRYKGHAISVFWRNNGTTANYSIHVDEKEVASTGGRERIILEQKHGRWSRKGPSAR